MNTSLAAPRKGARSIRDIPKGILRQLNRGEIETANLVEWLAVDQRRLLKHVLTQFDRHAYFSPIEKQIKALSHVSVTTLTRAIGAGLLQQADIHGDTALFSMIATHPSDSVRGWAAYVIGANDAVSISEKCSAIRPLAADPHFGVREVAWMALRADIAANLHFSLSRLSLWAVDPDERIRRFASEATRPRGVWCAHIQALKDAPHLALGILDPLHSDPSRYVQLSVGNWLNDAAKTQPEFVIAVCQRWAAQSDTKATREIIKRALRSLSAPK